MLFNVISHLEVDFHPVVHSLFHGEILFLQSIKVTCINQKWTMVYLHQADKHQQALSVFISNNLKKIAQIDILTVLWCRSHDLCSCGSSGFIAKSFLAIAPLLHYQFILWICPKCFVMDTKRNRKGKRNRRLTQWTASLMICGIFTWCQMQVHGSCAPHINIKSIFRALTFYQLCDLVF